MPGKPNQQGRPMVLAMLPAYAAFMVDSSPVVDRFKDGPEVLLRGPRVDTPEELVTPVPAVARAREENMPTVTLTARQWLTVASGGVVQVPDEQKTLDVPVEVRLRTWAETMLLNRQAITTIGEMMRDHPEWEGPPPIDKATAVRLTTPLDIPPALTTGVAEKFDGEPTPEMRAALAIFGF